MIRRPPRSTLADTPFPYTTRFRSFRVGRLTLDNRFVMAPMGRSSAQDGVLSPAYAPYYARRAAGRSEEHTSEVQSLMRISYAVFCLQKKITQNPTPITSLTSNASTMTTTLMSHLALALSNSH